MADELVLARLSVDPTGVVSGLATSDAAMRKGEVSLTKLGTTAQTVTGKFFNMRGALLRLAGAFGVIGLVTSLAVGLSRLVTDLITSTTWFKNLKDAVTDWWMELVKGEDALGRMARKMKDLTGGTGIKSVAESLDSLRELVTKRGELIGTMGSSDPLLMKAAVADVKQFNIAINESIAKLEKLGFTAKEISQLTGAAFTPGVSPAAAPSGGGKPGKTAAPAVDLWSVLGIPSPQEFGRQFGVLQDAAALLREQWHGGGMELQMYLTGIANLKEGLEALQLPAEAVAQIMENFGFTVEEIVSSGDLHELSAGIDEVTQNLTFQMAQMEAFQAISSGFANAVASAFFDAGVGMKKAIASMLRDLARVFLIKSLENLAIGIMASTPWGAAMGLGPPAPYFKAAGLFAGLAVAAGAAGAAIGGGGGRESAGVGGGGGGLAAGGQRGQTVTVVVHGSLLGVGGEDALARDLARLINTAESDGSR